MSSIRRFVCIALILVVAGCKPAMPESEVIVFAAASLTDSFTELEHAFEMKNPGVDVILNFASSSILRTQIEEGAAVDMFASANVGHMQILVDKGLVSEESARFIASTQLVIVTPLGNPAGIQDAEDLAGIGIRLVLALPEVPAGDYARQALHALNAIYGESYEPAVLANVASNEDNVRQVLLKVELGEGDAGFVYLTDAISSEEVKVIHLPQGYSPAVSYMIGIPASSRNLSLAEVFSDYLLSLEGQSILANWGFTPAAESPTP
jgi:molybdate transport system substrate-binding protein